MTIASTPLRRLPIKPEAFWAEFSIELHRRWSSDVTKGYFENKFWTPFMTKLLTKIAVAFNCHVDCEYWPRVDISYFDRCCGEWEEWAREVVIEHEAGADWTQELCKLMEINAGLKVLIAYPRNRAEIDKVLNRLPIIYQSRKYVTSPCSYLFIFGPYYDLKEFVAFTFDGKTIAEITDNTKIITSGVRGDDRKSDIAI